MKFKHTINEETNFQRTFFIYPIYTNLVNYTKKYSCFNSNKKPLLELSHFFFAHRLLPSPPPYKFAYSPYIYIQLYYQFK